LEEIVERLARVVAARCRGFPLDGGPWREEGTRVAGVLRRHARRERLIHAFEATAWIERHALRAGMQIVSTSRAPRVEPDLRRNRVAALRAADDLAKAGHVDVLWPVLRDATRPRRGARLLRFARRGFRRALAIVVLITALPVLPVIAHEVDCPSLILFSQLCYNPILVH